jgi:hypothetical protein
VCQKAILLFDRGFRRASLIKFLLDQGHKKFLIRLMAKVKVEGKRYTGLLSQYPLRPGRSVDLGWCRLRCDGVVTVRVIGIWKKDEDEPWWLATVMDDKLSKIVSIYDRRTSIEEQFRDSKGARYGAQMKWTHFQRPESLDRLWLVLALSLVAWTVTGILACRSDKTLRLMSRSKGPRRSYVSIGAAARGTLEVVLLLPWSDFAKLIPMAVFRSLVSGEKK